MDAMREGGIADWAPGTARTELRVAISSGFSITGLGFIMAGKVKQLIDRLIELRTKGERGLVAPLKIKLIMKGVDPDLYDETSPDNPLIIQRVIAIANELGYEIG